MATNQQTGVPDSPRGRFGRRGEAAAASWYQNNGYRVLASNWRCREGEIDLIVASGDTVVFVEVKARSTTRFGTGADAVDWRKQQKVRSVARHWLAGQPHHFPELRFDVVDVDARGTLQLHHGCF
jgi:putative endonuclease